MRPLTWALGASRPMAARKSWVLPDPDSPTTPTHSAGPIFNDTPLTASDRNAAAHLGAWRQQAHGREEKLGLARPGLADHADALGRPYIQRHAVDRLRSECGRSPGRLAPAGPWPRGKAGSCPTRTRRPRRRTRQALYSTTRR